MNMNEQDMIEWTVAVVEVTVVCAKHYFLPFLLRNIFPERATHSKGAMMFPSSLQLIHFRMLEMYSRCIIMFLRGT